MPIRIGSEPGSLGGVNKVYVGSDLIWPASTFWTPDQFGASMLVRADTLNTASLTINGSSRIDEIANTGTIGGVFSAQSANPERPLYSATAQNGLPGIFNDNSWDDGLAAAIGGSLPAGDSPSTIIVVGWMTVNNGNATSLLNWGNLAAVLSYRFVGGYYGNLIGDYGASGGLGNGGWVNEVRVASFEHEPGMNYGTESGVDFPPTAEDTITTASGNPLQLLRAPNVGLQEIIVLDRILTAVERLKVHGYMHHKWGLTANLLEAHPYKYAAPTV